MTPNRCGCRTEKEGRPYVCLAPATHAPGAHYFRVEPRVPGIRR